MMQLIGGSRALRVIGLAIAFFAIVGCETSGADGDKIARARLEVVGSIDRTFPSASNDTVFVRYVDAEGVAIRGVLYAQLEGSIYGATLTTASSQTDASGIARFDLRTGDRGDFDLVVTAPEAPTAAIVAYRFGADATTGVPAVLEYTVAYGGARPVTSVETALFTSASCATLQIDVPAAVNAQRTYLEATNRYDVSLAANVALYALGIDTAGNIAAATCKDIPVTATYLRERLLLEDITATGGLVNYDLDTTFPLDRSASPYIDGFVTRVHDLLTNPAEFMVDIVLNDESTPYQLRWYLSDRNIRRQVVDYLNYVFVTRMGTARLDELRRRGEQFEAALRSATLDTTITLGPRSVSGELASVHRVRALRLALPDRTVERPLNAEATAMVRTSPYLDIADHQLPLSLGQVMTAALEAFATTLGVGEIPDIMGGVIDCTPIPVPAYECPGWAPDMAADTCAYAARSFRNVVGWKLEQLSQHATLNYSAHATVTGSAIGPGQGYLRFTSRYDGSVVRFDGTLTGIGSATTVIGNGPAAVRERIRAIRP